MLLCLQGTVCCCRALAGCCVEFSAAGCMEAVTHAARLHRCDRYDDQCDDAGSSF